MSNKPLLFGLLIVAAGCEQKLLRPVDCAPWPLDDDFDTTDTTNLGPSPHDIAASWDAVRFEPNDPGFPVLVLDLDPATATAEGRSDNTPTCDGYALVVKAEGSWQGTDAPVEFTWGDSSYWPGPNPPIGAPTEPPAAGIEIEAAGTLQGVPGSSPALLAQVREAVTRDIELQMFGGVGAIVVDSAYVVIDNGNADTMTVDVKVHATYTVDGTAPTDPYWLLVVPARMVADGPAPYAGP